MNICSALLFYIVFLFGPDGPLTQSGSASYYSDKFQGRRTASGERYNKNQLTAAHATLPFNTLVEVICPQTNQKVVVRINDRLHRNNKKVIDISKAAARELGIIRLGIAKVELKEVLPEQPAQAVPEPLIALPTDSLPADTTACLN